MNSRSTILLLVFLLFQAGQACRLGATENSHPSCAMACCQHQAHDQAQCGCDQELPQDPATPTAPPAQARDTVPQFVWTLVEWLANPSLHELASKTHQRSLKVRDTLPAGVSMTILHCAFLT